MFSPRAYTIKSLHTVCFSILVQIDLTDLPQRPASSLAIPTATHPQFEMTITYSSFSPTLPFAVLESARPASASHSRVLNPTLLPFTSQIPLLAKPAAKEEPIRILHPFRSPLPGLRLLLFRPCVSPSPSISVSEIAVRISISVLKTDHPRRLIIRKRARHHRLAPPRPCCWHPIEPMYLSLWRQMAASNWGKFSPHKDSVFPSHHNAFW